MFLEFGYSICPSLLHMTNIEAKNCQNRNMYPPLEEEHWRVIVIMASSRNLSSWFALGIRMGGRPGISKSHSHWKSERMVIFQCPWLVPSVLSYFRSLDAFQCKIASSLFILEHSCCLNWAWKIIEALFSPHPHPFSSEALGWMWGRPEGISFPRKSALLFLFLQR